jgi:hypothetical protein
MAAAPATVARYAGCPCSTDGQRMASSSPFIGDKRQEFSARSFWAVFREHTCQWESTGNTTQSPRPGATGQ